MTAYHVTLDGRGYVIDPQTYRRSVANPTPKHPIAQLWHDWRGGFGYGVFEPAHPDRYDVGPLIDPTQGDLRLGRALTSVYNPGSGTATDLFAFAVYQGELFLIEAAGGQVFSSTDGSSWAVAVNTGETSLRAIALFDGRLIVASGANGNLITWNGVTWVSPWVTLTGSSVRSLIAWSPDGATEYLFAGVSQAGGTSDLVRVDSAGTATVLHTSQLPHIEALTVNGAGLWFACVDDTAGVRGELFLTDSSTFRRVAEIPDNAISSFASFRGQLLAGSRTRGVIWSIGPQGPVELFRFPDLVGIGGVSSYAFAVRSMLVDSDRLHVPILDASNGLGLYVYDGHGWSNPVAGGLGQEPRGIAAFAGALYLSNKSTTGARVYEVSSTDHPTTATLTTPKFDAADPTGIKHWLWARLAFAPLIDGDEISIDYALDESDSFQQLGSVTTADASTATFAFEADVTSRRIRLNITITAASSTATPRLYALSLGYLTAHSLRREWAFDVLLEGSAELPLITLDQQPEPDDASALTAALWASKAKQEVLELEDLDGSSAYVLFLDLTQRVAPRSQRVAASSRGSVLLVEADVQPFVE